VPIVTITARFFPITEVTLDQDGVVVEMVEVDDHGAAIRRWPGESAQNPREVEKRRETSSGVE
jgi:hypothetical protein